MAKKPAKAKAIKKKPVARKQSGKKQGGLKKPFTAPVIVVKQHSHKLYMFKAKASVLFDMLSINRRDQDITKEKGYQRVLPISRVKAISTFVSDKNVIPNPIIVTFDEAEVKAGKIIVPAGDDVGWVIDGQHRLAGAYEAAISDTALDIEMSVTAFIGLDIQEQIKTFITINREAKTVPTSLVLDLIRNIPTRRPSDIANERAADIAKALTQKKDSPFLNRIVIDAPRANQMSLTNFVRKTTPLVIASKGRLKNFTFEQQVRIFDNYFKSVSKVFEGEWKATNSIFFKTLGFGAMMNVFERIFNEVTERENAFSVETISKYLGYVSDFDFDQWKSYGSGNKAETEAAKDFELDFDRRLAEQVSTGEVGQLRLDD